jgi:hypothetical protein
MDILSSTVNSPENYCSKFVTIATYFHGKAYSVAVEQNVQTKYKQSKWQAFGAHHAVATSFPMEGKLPRSGNFQPTTVPNRPTPFLHLERVFPSYCYCCKNNVHGMQSFTMSSVTRYDPVQRAEQWKQMVGKEDIAPGVVAYANKRSMRAPLSNMHLVPGFSTGVDDEEESVGPLPKFNQADLSKLKKSSRSTLQSSARSRFEICFLCFASYILLNCSLSGRSSRTSSSSPCLSSRSYSSSIFSLGSSGSNMTAKAFERLERLEASLNEEKEKRASAEKQLRQLQEIVDDRLSGPATGSRQGSARTARSTRSGRSGRSGMSSARSEFSRGSQLSARSERVLSLQKK